MPFRPFRGRLEKWSLWSHSLKAVLVRPDRYVFGTGEQEPSADQWKRARSMRIGVRALPKYRAA